MLDFCNAINKAGHSRIAEVWPHELVDRVHGRHMAHQCYNVGLLACVPNKIVLHGQRMGLGDGAEMGGSRNWQ